MKRPWNIPDLAVYSLATYENGKVNMNICTYVSAISMQPKRYMIGVYEGTKSLENIKKADHVILQLLHPDQYKLVRVLGKKSGQHFDKHQWLENNHLLVEWKGKPVLKNTSALLLLKKHADLSGGDHHMFVMDTIGYTSNSEDYLTTRILGEKKIIRI
jgi:flavin reductase (DIM6/NTAB) family NADH-FMN oxidoreductase RutF